MDDTQRKVNEFCVEGNLEEYRSTLSEIFSNIHSGNCRICARYDKGPSIHEFPSNNKKCIIRIPVKRFLHNPIETIWTILHEFGHHVSGSIEKSELTDAMTIKREEEAWEYARDFLKNHDELRTGIDEFNIYADRCLNSYKQNIAKKRNSKV